MKLIPLDKGLFSKIDDADFDRINQHHWWSKKTGNTFIAKRKTSKRINGKRKYCNFLMHKEIIGKSIFKNILHIDGDKLNNQRCNLLETNFKYVPLNFIGKKFGQLTPIERVCKTRSKKWKCKCDCGNIIDVFQRHLLHGKFLFCKSDVHIRKTKHGMASRGKTDVYKIYTGMKNRCNNKKNPQYRLYGGRGISVCNRWEKSVLDFINDMGERPTQKHSIDRINVNGNYEPVNCRWATQAQQSNNKRNTVYLEYNGEIKSVHEWCLETGIKHNTIKARIKRGWSIENTLQTPIK